MNKLIKISLLMLLPSLLLAQGGIINDAAKIQVSAGTQVKIGGGGVINQNSGEITNEGNMYIDANWTQLGVGATYTGNGWMWFENGTNQTLSSVSAITVPKLRVGNGNKLILASNVIVSTAVDFMINSSIELGTNNLVLSSAATMANYNATSYVITNSTGVLQREVSGTAVDFPVGNSTYNPATLTNTGVLDNFQIRVIEQVLEEGTTGTIQTADVVGRTWLVDEAVVGGSLVDMTLQWEQADELTAFDRTTSGITHHLSGSLWDNPSAYTAATNVSGTTWSQTRAGFTSFSPFVVRDLDVDLPVELLYFNAERQSIDEVKLTWATAVEINNQGFEIQRMLEHETEFEALGFVQGQGTTVNTNYYQYLDPNTYTDVSYYRLKQIDIDGTVSYSEIRAVSGQRNQNGVAINLNIYPNPVVGELNVEFNDLPKSVKNAKIQILSVSGQLVYEFTNVLQAYQVLTINQVADLTPAVYILSIELDNGEEMQQKFIKK